MGGAAAPVPPALLAPREPKVLPALRESEALRAPPGPQARKAPPASPARRALPGLRGPLGSLAPWESAGPQAPLGYPALLVLRGQRERRGPPDP